MGECTQIAFGSLRFIYFHIIMCRARERERDKEQCNAQLCSSIFESYVIFSSPSHAINDIRSILSQEMNFLAMVEICRIAFAHLNAY